MTNMLQAALTLANQGRIIFPALILKDKKGKTIAALNISGHTSRVTAKEMTTHYLPALKETILKIEEALHKL